VQVQSVLQMSDYIDQAVGDIWFMFGEHANGCVDLNDGTNDVFTHITKDQAEKLIAARARFLAEVRAVYETMPRLGCDQSRRGKGAARFPCAECARPLSAEALAGGLTLCSPECVDDYYGPVGE
jgi:hypothetical protein